MTGRLLIALLWLCACDGPAVDPGADAGPSRDGVDASADDAGGRARDAGRAAGDAGAPRDAQLADPPDPNPDCLATQLAAVAAATEPGEFTELTVPGYDEDLLDSGGGHHILQYTDEAVWDPNTCQVLFTGGGHLTTVKFVAFDTAEHVFAHAPNPSWWCDPNTAPSVWPCVNHAYGHNALDVRTGDYFYRQGDVYRIRASRPLASEWEALPELPDPASRCLHTSLEYSPELGGLVFIACGNADESVYFLPDGGDAWERIAGPLPMGPYHTYARHNPRWGAIAFGLGNGSRDLHLLSADRSVRRLPDPPQGFHPAPQEGTTSRILTYDPVTGAFLALSSDRMHALDPATETWSSVDVAIPTELHAAAPIDDLQGILFLRARPARVFFYRHARP